MAKKNANQQMASQSTMTRQNFNPRSPNQQRPNPFISPYIQTVNPKSTIGKPSQSLFESELLFNVELNVVNLIYLNSIQAQYLDPPVSEKQLYYDVKHLYTEFLFQIMPMITNPINAVVPKDTGRLRATILQSIQGNMYGGNGSYTRLGNLHPFTVMINTGKLRYAPIVNEMPSEWLKHFGFGHNGSTNMNNKQYQHKWKPKQKTPHKLMDPGAETDWFGKLVNAGQQIWQTLWANYIRGDFARYFTNTITRSNTGLRMPGQVYLDLLSITTLLWNRGVP